jgi:hypothetical protein
MQKQRTIEAGLGPPANIYKHYLMLTEWVRNSWICWRNRGESEIAEYDGPYQA